MTISKVFTEKKPITAKTIVDKALSFIGTYDGGNNNVIFNTDYYGKEVSGSNFPWCAAFLWDIFRMCNAEKLFCDGAKTAYCPYIHSWGQRSGQLIDKTKGEYGDIVLFDWNGDGISDHVGLILSRNSNGTYETVEGNTASYNYSNGGYVLKMTRYYSSILAIIRPKYESEENGRDTVKTTEKKFVIDVSEHQGVIDWNKVKSKIDGAIIRCGYGDDITSQDDKQYVRNLSECERLKIPKGIYLYSYATTETQAKSELAHILRLIKGHTFELPIFLDCEEAGTESFAPKACKIICDGVKAAGFTPGVYSSLFWWNTYLTEVTEYVRWVAQWSSVCTYNGIYSLWQYSETGKVDGIGTAVDMNYLYDNIEETAAADTVENTNTTATTNKTDTANIGTSSLDIRYQVYTDKSGWLPVVKNLEDYAGVDGEPIKGIRVYLDGDTLAVQTHHMANGNIDKLTIFAGKHTIRYRVRTIGSKDYFSWMENKKDTGGSSDTFAGESGKSIDRLQIIVKE